MAPRRVTPLLRFRSKVKFVFDSNSCWEWQGWLTPKGYGLFWNGKKTVSAHRWFYVQTRGPIPPGLTIDHLCRNKRCVRPSLLGAGHHQGEQAAVGYDSHSLPGRSRVHRCQHRMAQALQQSSCYLLLPQVQ